MNRRRRPPFLRLSLSSCRRGEHDTTRKRVILGGDSPPLFFLFLLTGRPGPVCLIYFYFLLNGDGPMVALLTCKICC